MLLYRWFSLRDRLLQIHWVVVGDAFVDNKGNNRLCADFPTGEREERYSTPEIFLLKSAHLNTLTINFRLGNLHRLSECDIATKDSCPTMNQFLDAASHHMATASDKMGDKGDNGDPTHSSLKPAIASMFLARFTLIQYPRLRTAI